MTVRYQFTSIKEYENEFTNIAFWWSASDRVCKEHHLIASLTDVNIRSGLSSTNPVFIVDERFVIKFDEIHLFRSGIRNFQLSDLIIPQLITSGTLDDRPYIIIKLMPDYVLPKYAQKLDCQTFMHSPHCSVIRFVIYIKFQLIYTIMNVSNPFL
jgi:hypothetical protein